MFNVVTTNPSATGLRAVHDINTCLCDNLNEACERLIYRLCAHVFTN